MSNMNLSELFGKNVFDDNVMRERLPKSTYKQLHRTIDEGLTLEASVAEVVANAMKDWAIERGATHFTHWFQPMNGKTAEKHDSFLSPTSDGRVIMEFSGKELIKGEADGSSFPSGGIRQTFEARGYTVWDCTSPAFLKEDASGVALCIPTAFYSHTGEALDKKSPLLRSMECIQAASLRILNLLGETNVRKVTATVGAEQEYFLIDKRHYQQRKDLIFTGRTLFGAQPPKGQEMEDHYYGSIKEKIAKYMREIDLELWKLGVPSKTKHNEVAPAQHELAPLFATSNVACDQNQLIMEVLQKVANHHDLACLLHAKPFAGINGSGKHVNWSLATDTGRNIFSPGKHPHENKIFLIFLVAVIKAVDKYSDLLRMCAASAGNDHRLGGHEAPPAIISIFLGDELTNILEHIAHNEAVVEERRQLMEMGVSTLPKLKKESTDRNRTSPFAFTGNKFEFRMFPSSESIAEASTIMNTIVADALTDFAEELEKASDLDKAINRLIKDTYLKHQRIIFNGNGYSEEWVEEAKARGLSNYATTVDVLPSYISEESISLFGRMQVYNATEIFARYEIMLEEYYKVINIEAKTMLDIAKKQILPACIYYSTEVGKNVEVLKHIGSFDITAQLAILDDLTKGIAEFKRAIDALDEKVIESNSIKESLEKARFFKNEILPCMEHLRSISDMLENQVDEKVWPLPTYGEILFRA
ncbi:glutamine synthetase type III [Sporanaerobium hydrogeniformans]|uniref:Glutamine synthetase type III n=1 Tax=Sporanaerobium hydrogeniformans TaxID=3072179 RepID=A0AC61DCF7_9FIRM|nr:glutamine synthetase III [Lachnospiraceae bacterium]PHV70677.1 glutamine synthetase type III [Sporanaerobium hydrogeniformans]